MKRKRMMKEVAKDKRVKDERDEQINTDSKSMALDLMTAAAEILTIMCWIKGNSAWRGCLGVVCFGIAASLLYKYLAYQEKPYAWIGILFGLIGAALFVWFGITG